MRVQREAPVRVRLGHVGVVRRPQRACALAQRRKHGRFGREARLLRQGWTCTVHCALCTVQALALAKAQAVRVSERRTRAQWRAVNLMGFKDTDCRGYATGTAHW